MSFSNVIFEICKTDRPSYSGGIYKSPWQNGFKIKSSSEGIIKARYVNDPIGVYRDLLVPGTNFWSIPDRLIELKEDVSNTLDLNDVVVGTGFND